MREWLKGRAVVWLAGEGHAGDECLLEVTGFRRQAFKAGSENHALCLAVLLTDYTLKQGRKIPTRGFSGRALD